MKQPNHPLQSFEWGEFRKKTGIKVVRTESFQLTIHKIPNTPFNIGYLPKGAMPDQKLIDELKAIGKNEKCIFIQIEPNVEKGKVSPNILISQYPNIRPSFHPLFSKYTFVLNLTKSEDELLKNMHSKTRYNIKVAQKHGVGVIEDNSDKAFEDYIKLTKETSKRQGFYAHSEKYHRLMWKTLKGKIAHLFVAKYKSKILAAWVVFVFRNAVYYPYGASSDENREVMASNLMMWEVIKWGKKMGLKKFDMWGALRPNPNTNDPWYGFHRFKEGYGGELIEFVGSYDLVLNPFLYELYKIADKIRWLFLRNSI